jgi:hypothetical protein
VATDIHLDQSPPIGRNGLHCIEFPHYMRKFLLNLSLGEPLSLVQELSHFENMIKMKTLLESTLDLCVHDMIGGLLFYVVMVELCRCQLFCYL